MSPDEHKAMFAQTDKFLEERAYRLMELPKLTPRQRQTLDEIILRHAHATREFNRFMDKQKGHHS